MAVDRTVAPPTTPFSHISLPAETVETLPNGVEFHVVNTGEQPISRLSLFWDGGTLDSTNPCVPGLMVEAMRGSTTGLTGAEIDDAVDFNGGRLAGRAADHYTGLDLISLNSRLGDLLPVLGEIATNADFPEEAVGVPARKASANRALQLSKVSYRAATRVRQAMQGAGHPASRVAMPDDFLAVTPAEVRRAYSSMCSCRKHAFLGGSFDETTIGRVREFLESLPASGQSPILVQPYSPEGVGRFFDEMPDAKQSAVSMALPAIGRNHPDYIALRLAVMALGGYFGSRLMSNIREEKGLTYGINAALLGNREGASMEIDAQCDARSVEAVVEETRREILDLRSNPPRGAELNRLRLNAWSALASATDSSFGILDHYITRLLVGTPADYFRMQLDELEKLTPDRIAEVATSYLDPAMLRVSVCGAAGV